MKKTMIKNLVDKISLTFWGFLFVDYSMKFSKNTQD